MDANKSGAISHRTDPINGLQYTLRAVQAETGECSTADQCTNQHLTPSLTSHPVHVKDFVSPRNAHTIAYCGLFSIRPSQKLLGPTSREPLCSVGVQLHPRTCKRPLHDGCHHS
jgi:hypothetical protein